MALIEGFVESIGGGKVLGWCFDRSAPSLHIEVELLLADTVVARGVASQMRPHLRDAGIGRGDHGFSIHVQAALLAENRQNLAVRASGGGISWIMLPRLDDPMPAAAQEPVETPQRRPDSQRIPHCLLHIGMEKTGTTSLQHFIGIHRDALLRQGVLAPRSLAPNAGTGHLNHILLATVAMDINSDSAPLRATFGVTGRTSVRRHRLDIADALGAEIEAHGQACHSLLLSNEHCQSRLKQDGEIDRLRRWLLSFCDTVQVVLYLRPQLDVAVSSYGTILKDGAINRTILPGPEDRGSEQAYDYDRLVARWERVFGPENMEIRLYPEDVVTDFFDCLLMDTGALKRARRRENGGLDHTAERALAALNRSLAERAAGDVKRVREILLEALEATHSGRGASPSRCEATAFQHRFDDSNERLRARRFADRATLFETDLSVYEETPRHASSLTVDEFAATMADVLAYLSNRQSSIGPD